MDTINYTSSESYPVSQTINIDGQEVDLSRIEAFAPFLSKNARERLLDFTRAKRQEAVAAGDLSPHSNPFFADLVTLIHQHMHALATLESIAAGSFTSTEDNPQYAGNIVSEGNRIFTPQEAAQNALDAMENVHL